MKSGCVSALSLWCPFSSLSLCRPLPFSLLIFIYIKIFFLFFFFFGLSFQHWFVLPPICRLFGVPLGQRGASPPFRQAPRWNVATPPAPLAVCRWRPLDERWAASGVNLRWPPVSQPLPPLGGRKVSHLCTRPFISLLIAITSSRIIIHITAGNFTLIRRNAVF